MESSAPKKSAKIFANQKASMEQKLRILDGFVCQILYQPTPPFLKNAERLVRLALDWHPARSLLKGSLGAVMAEQGKFVEPNHCCRNVSTPARRSRPEYCLLLFGVVKLGRGKNDEAKPIH